MAFDVLPGLGVPLRRLEDPRLLTGGGRYASNRRPPGTLVAIFLRSPHAHARLDPIDRAPALAIPGVVAVYTAAEAELGHNPALTAITDPQGRRHLEPPRPAIARGRVRHVGEIVAMILAETEAAARDGAEALAPLYDPLPAIATGQAALAPGAPDLHAEVPGNLICAWQKGDAAAVAAAMAHAAHVTRLTHRSPRILAGYLEPRAALAEPDGAGGITLTTPSQGAHVIQRVLADHLLRWPRARLRVVTEDVGGGFGPKLPPYAEQALVAFAAADLNRPVRWVQERTEHHLADTQARDLVAEGQLALDADGRFLALSVRGIAAFGAYVSTVAPTIPTFGMAKVITGLYAIPAAHLALDCVLTSTAPVDAVRGAGKPEALALLEALVDQAARETGRDPLALRALNLVPAGAFPFTTALGYRLDSGDYPALLAAATSLADAAGYAARQAESAARGQLRGRGVACHLHGSGGWADETSQVSIDTSGAVTLRTGTQSQGQGHATAYVQVVAAALGVAPVAVRLVQGDTSEVLRGGGTGGSSSTIISAGTLARAAEALVEAGRPRAADLLEAALVDIEWQAGAYAVAGTDRRVTLLQVAAASGGLTGRAEFDATVESWPAGVAIAEVEVDPETGRVTLDRFAASVDAGRVINPMLLAGQLHGGFAAGIGQALMENALYDAEGQMLAATLMDYAMPRADDLPGFLHVDQPSLTPNNPLGIKGVGELPTNGAPAAVANAVRDAIGVAGDLDLPLTAARVWALLNPAACGPRSPPSR